MYTNTIISTRTSPQIAGSLPRNIEKDEQEPIIPEIPEDEQKEKGPTPALQEYMKRPQFTELMGKEKDENEYSNQLHKLWRDKEFLEKTNLQIRTNEGGGLTASYKEEATFKMGQYYYKHWTDFKFGKPEIAVFGSKFELIYNVATGNLYFPLISIPFDVPYRTVYDAEQSFKYYLKTYPDGDYVVPALLSIARSRIHQEDYCEAYQVFKYALRVSMQEHGFDNKSVADTLAHELLYYGKKYKDGFNISLNISVNKMGDDTFVYRQSEHQKTDYYFDKSKNTFNIRISYRRAF